MNGSWSRHYQGRISVRRDAAILLFLVAEHKLVAKLSCLMDTLGVWEDKGSGPVGLILDEPQALALNDKKLYRSVGFVKSNCLDFEYWEPF